MKMSCLSNRTQSLTLGWCLAFLALLGPSISQAAISVTINSARWDAARQTLRTNVSGSGFSGRPYATLYYYDGISGAELGTKRVFVGSGEFTRSASWPFTENSQVPCSLRVKIRGVNSATKEVAAAPPECSGGARQNQPPAANAGSDQTFNLTSGQSSIAVTLDGSGSSDPDGTVVDYLWSGLPKPEDSVTPTLTLGPGTYTFTLVVADNDGARSSPDSVDIMVRAPVADLGELKVLGANDLGMHCADLDYQVFSILPPYNVLHAQVVERGTSGKPARILGDDEVSLYYRASSSPNDPVGAGSTTTTSLLTSAGALKSNFWTIDPVRGNTLAYLNYGPLYPYVSATGDFLLGAYEPLPGDIGLPVPDTFELSLGNLVLHQQAMPGAGNTPQRFSRFDTELPFFTSLPVGLHLSSLDWFVAEGVPMVPLDDQGRLNPYPLMELQARDVNGDAVLASTSVVVPVANEADCQTCHASASDGYSGIAAEFASVNTDSNPGNDFNPMNEAEANTAGMGPEYLLNAAKMNILRLHDAKHGTSLEQSRPVQCSQCHYSPALDLAQVGPIDEPEAGPKGRQQTRHVSMSRAMHGFHGALTAFGKKLFPEMPPIRDGSGKLRSMAVTQSVLEETCYQCHPGKQTRCLRGAMETGGMVCQDCHGSMEQVGNDFSGRLSAQNPAPQGLDYAKRVPWLSELRCDSCHVGDAVATNQPADGLLARDGIRLLQAYSTIELGDGTTKAEPYTSPGSRFAQNQTLYRFSTGHGGLMCEGCHGSTHAIFPNPRADANDNLTTTQLQGHSGTLIECTTCHAAGTLGLTLDGPHGMHAVGDSRWIQSHKEVADDHPDRCTACHGSDGLGTVLSQMAITRTMARKDSGTVTLAEGYAVGCVECHENKISH